MENIEQKNLTVTESRKLYERYEGGNNRTPGELWLMMEFTESAGNVFSENMINDMADLGFFRYPASQTFHGTQDGGLYEHSMAVFRQLRYFTSHLDLKWQRPESPLLIGIFHDWAKLQNYEQIGSEDDLRYIHSTERLFPGHGEVSIILAQQFLQNHISAPQFTEEEIACIRYHMGAFTDQKEWDYYTNAIRKYPNVLWTHTSDMVTSQIHGI